MLRLGLGLGLLRVWVCSAAGRWSPCKCRRSYGNYCWIWLWAACWEWGWPCWARSPASGQWSGELALFISCVFQMVSSKLPCHWV